MDAHPTARATPSCFYRSTVKALEVRGIVWRTYCSRCCPCVTPVPRQGEISAIQGRKHISPQRCNLERFLKPGHLGHYECLLEEVNDVLVTGSRGEIDALTRLATQLLSGLPVPLFGSLVGIMVSHGASWCVSAPVTPCCLSEAKRETPVGRVSFRCGPFPPDVGLPAPI